MSKFSVYVLSVLIQLCGMWIIVAIAEGYLRAVWGIVGIALFVLGILVLFM